jgi:hypothetical protein
MIGLVSADDIDVMPGIDQISGALLNAYPGDALVLAAGEYTETQSLVTNMDITIKAAPGAEVIWHAPDGVPTILVEGDLHVENIIFLAGDDTLRAENCILNNYGSVNAGEEPAAEKNSIFVDGCMFLRFCPGENGAAIEVPDPDGDSKTHPVDTLYVTNSLFYGTALGTHRGMDVGEGQVHIAKIQNCTGWNIIDDGFQINGHKTVLDYIELLIDHITVYNCGSIEFPLGHEGVGTYTYYLDANDTIRNSIFSHLGDFGIKAKKGNFAEATYDYLLGHEIGWGCPKCSAFYYAITEADALGLNCQIADPLFTNPNAGDYSLLPGSPAIGAGHDGSNLGNLITDWSRAVTIAGAPATEANDVDQETPQIVDQFMLYQNYPNPFNPTTTISYALPKTEHVVLTIHNIQGQKIRTLVNGVKNHGAHSVTWDGQNDAGNVVAGGIYFYKMQTTVTTETNKMVLLK